MKYEHEVVFTLADYPSEHYGSASEFGRTPEHVCDGIGDGWELIPPMQVVPVVVDNIHRVMIVSNWRRVESPLAMPVVKLAERINSHGKDYEIRAEIHSNGTKIRVTQGERADGAMLCVTDDGSRWKVALSGCPMSESMASVITESLQP